MRRLTPLVLICCSVALADMTTTRLTAETRRAFDSYVKRREVEIERRQLPTESLWCLDQPGCPAALKRDGVFVDGHGGRGLEEIKGGLVHDWVGATFIRGATLDQTLALLRNYANHKTLFAPEVMESKTLDVQGDHYTVYLKLRKKKILTVVLNTEYDVIYRKTGAYRACSRSYSTKVAEVEEGRELPVGHDHGFMWRLNAYWRFQEQDGGVYVECETISLSRPVPMMLHSIMAPILKQLPRESLEKTLAATRAALEKR